MCEYGRTAVFSDLKIYRCPCRHVSYGSLCHTVHHNPHFYFSSNSIRVDFRFSFNHEILFDHEATAFSSFPYPLRGAWQPLIIRALRHKVHEAPSRRRWGLHCWCTVIRYQNRGCQIPFGAAAIRKLLILSIRGTYSCLPALFRELKRVDNNIEQVFFVLLPRRIPNCALWWLMLENRDKSPFFSPQLKMNLVPLLHIERNRTMEELLKFWISSFFTSFKTRFFVPFFREHGTCFHVQ